MGTRSITTVRSTWGDHNGWTTHATIYRHWDGYPEGHGKWLHEFLDGLAVVNGIGGDMPEKWANGPGRLAAALVAALHKDGHEPDLMEPGTVCGQEFEYQIDVRFGMEGGEISVTVFNGPMTFFGAGGEDCSEKMFTGSVAEFGDFVQRQTAA